MHDSATTTLGPPGLDSRARPRRARRASPSSCRGGFTVERERVERLGAPASSSLFLAALGCLCERGRLCAGGTGLDLSGGLGAGRSRGLVGLRGRRGARDEERASRACSRSLRKSGGLVGEAGCSAGWRRRGSRARRASGGARSGSGSPCASARGYRPAPEGAVGSCSFSSATRTVRCSVCVEGRALELSRGGSVR